VCIANRDRRSVTNYHGRVHKASAPVVRVSGSAGVAFALAVRSYTPFFGDVLLEVHRGEIVMHSGINVLPINTCASDTAISMCIKCIRSSSHPACFAPSAGGTESDHVVNMQASGCIADAAVVTQLNIDASFNGRCVA
jgi:hypothetical protein